MADPVFFHVDMDAFYAAVEMRDRPELRGKPLLVGWDSQHRGVVAACSYEARRFGIHSAMPMSTAKRLCPDAVVVPVDMHRYQTVSRRIHAVFREFSPVVQAISIDEAFLDMSGTERLLGPPEASARRLKERVRALTELTVSVGVGCSRFIAKLASDVDKPDGLHVVRPGSESDFVLTLELKDLWGLGKQTRLRLDRLGIDTVETLRAKPIEYLRGHFGESGGEFLHRVARGEDPGIYTGTSAGHSISGERTFAEDIDDREELRLRVLALSQEIMQRTRREEWIGRTVTVKYRYSDFETHTHQQTVPRPVADADELFGIAWNLFTGRWNGTPLRLIGVGISGSVESADTTQLDMFTDDRNRSIEEAALQLEDKLGKPALRRASLVSPPKRAKAVKVSDHTSGGESGEKSRKT